MRTAKDVSFYRSLAPTSFSTLRDFFEDGANDQHNQKHERHDGEASGGLHARIGLVREMETNCIRAYPKAVKQPDDMSSFNFHRRTLCQRVTILLSPGKPLKQTRSASTGDLPVVEVQK